MLRALWCAAILVALFGCKNTSANFSQSSKKSKQAQADYSESDFNVDPIIPSNPVAAVNPTKPNSPAPPQRPVVVKPKLERGFYAGLFNSPYLSTIQLQIQSGYAPSVTIEAKRIGDGMCMSTTVLINSNANAATYRLGSPSNGCPCKNGILQLNKTVDSVTAQLKCSNLANVAYARLINCGKRKCELK